MARWLCLHFLNMACLMVLCLGRFSFLCIPQILLAWCALLVCFAQAYADDLQVYCHLSPGEEHIALQRFRSCSDSVSRWMTSNRLKLNPSKAELIWLHSSIRNPGFIQNDIELFGNFITPVRVVRNLGVILDENMTMLVTYLVSVKDATTNFYRFKGSGSHYLLPLNFFWFLSRCIVGWTIVIEFYTHCLGLVYSCSSLC